MNEQINSLIFLKIYFFNLFIFREGKGGRKRGRGTSTCGFLLRTPLLGTWPATQACALTRNQTGNPLVLRSASSPLSHISQGNSLI